MHNLRGFLRLRINRVGFQKSGTQRSVRQLFVKLRSILTTKSQLIAILVAMSQLSRENCSRLRSNPDDSWLSIPKMPQRLKFRLAEPATTRSNGQPNDVPCVGRRLLWSQLAASLSSLSNGRCPLLNSSRGQFGLVIFPLLLSGRKQRDEHCGKRDHGPTSTYQTEDRS